ncbi:glycine cleavage system protein R [Algibacillus agarilyticus]|uniref:glycine cleavage system protein R n=1 Tax=Algibacillus agarilyticus TaxID=2234133 RepID=UPI000DCFC06B|nr:ACT domain-containing protein [Algibacillus agarilyticus]
MIKIITSLITNDKPGIIEQLAKIVTHHNGNWEASNFSQLAGKFAGVVEISVAEEQQTQLITALQQLQQADFIIDIATSSLSNEQAKTSHIIEVTGNDRNGIIKDVSSVLAKNNINVLKLSSETSPAPNWGGNLFKAIIEIQASDTNAIDAAIDGLESITDDLIVDITLL